MEIDQNKKMMLESMKTLFNSCHVVGGAPPNLNMTLQDFITTYGWNEVVFGVSDFYAKGNIKN